ncbi:MAG: T9SS type A sorting domain-containing protein [Bacteroidetes bacterium]|nr:T9SS type A sorting domain-containing protein [Bacteroidota bacterium]
MKLIKKLLLTHTFFVIGTIGVYGQKNQKFDPTNAREGEKVEFCHQHKKMAQLMQNPEFAAMYEQDKIAFDKLKNKAVPKGVVYKIPIVFHVLHNNGVENISDEQIYNAVEILNRDFRKLNPDTATVQSDFVGMPSDVEIEFVLATKAPNGTCFKGITRTSSPLSYQGDDGSAQVTAIRNGNDVYQQSWPGNRYLNVFICGEIGGAAGYTTNPSAWSATSMSNGIWILHDYVGSIGTGSTGGSRALTHEVGHWLNLDHTWGSNNNPGNSSSCSTDDDVEDTPNCIGVTACLLNANTCNSVNDYWDYDVRDNVENYMDYSYCSKMFTPGQTARMRAALQGTTTGRFNLWQTANLNATGATGELYLCKAEFQANRTTICLGDSIQLSDDSYNVVNGWNWEITPATGWSFGSGSSASSQNPMINFSTSGLYSIKLTATDGTTTDEEIKSNYIRVLPESAVLPYWEGFESYTTLANLTNWEVVNPSNNNAWTIENTTGHSGAQCAKLVNYNQTVGNIDELISAPIDLSVIPSNEIVTLSFRYAYRKRTSADYEYLKVFVSANCGENWAQRKTIGGNQLSSQTATTSWKPTQANDWVTVHMVNVTSNYFSENFKMKFRFEADGGNNIYLDDINLYAGAPSDNLVLGIDGLNDIQDIQLYPNPTEGDVHIRYNAMKNEKLTVVITDITGKTVSTSLVTSKEGSNLIILPTDGMASGTYFVELGNNLKALKFVVK